MFFSFIPTTKAAVAFVVSSSAGCTGSCTATTSGIDTTGATLLVAAVNEYFADPTLANMSDSNGNTWHHLTMLDDSATSGMEFVIWYAYDHGGSALSVGSGHTFSYAGTSYAGLTVMAYSGTQTSSDPFDQQNKAGTAAGFTAQPGSITPTVDNELVVTYVQGLIAADETYSINSSYNKRQELFYNGNANMGGADIVQTTAGATNPTWTSDNSPRHLALIASFKAATGGGGGTTDSGLRAIINSPKAILNANKIIIN